MANDLMARYDIDGNNGLEQNEFLELLCPDGFRAHPQATQAIDKEGQQLVWCSSPFFEGWTLEGAFSSLPANLKLDLEVALNQDRRGAFLNVPETAKGEEESRRLAFLGSPRSEGSPDDMYREIDMKQATLPLPVK